MAERLDSFLGASLLEATPHGTVAIEADRVIRYVNPAAERIFGLSADEAIGRPLEVLIPETARELHRQGADASAREADRTLDLPNEVRVRGRRADGSTFPAEVSVLELTWGEQPVLVAIVTDISERHALEEERRRLAEILEASPDFVGIADPEGQVIYRNPAARRLLGHEDEAGITRSEVKHVHAPHSARKVLEEAFPAARRNGWWEGETVFLNADGEEVPVSQLILAHRGEHGEVRYFSTVARDLRAYRRSEEERRKLTRALTQTADMVWITDTEGIVEFVNPSFEVVTGFSAAEAIGEPTSALLQHGHLGENLEQHLWERLSRGETFRDVFTEHDRNGQALYLDETISPVTDDDGELSHYIFTARDVTERLQLEERLRQLAYYDPLTGLANRAHFEAQLEQALRRARRHDREVAVLFLDLDRFKYVNDTLGHAAGDEVLSQVSVRLSARLRNGDLVARLGGDELACLLEPVKGTSGAARVARRLLAAMNEPFEVQGHTFRLNASIGISFFPDTAEDSGALIRQADTSMFEAKQAGGSQYRFFSEALSEATAQRFHFEKGLRQALEEGSLRAHFQPLVGLPDQRVVGAEALARCELPGWGEVSPGQFVPVAEETGLIHELGDQVLAQACRCIRRWEEAGHRLDKIAVNLSPVQLQDGRLPRRVGDILDRTGLAPHRLELEITEETLLGGEETLLRRLAELRDMGVGIALDDFGTGYSSPAYLKRIPTHRIKIDRAFVRNVDRDPVNQTILRSLLVLAEGFGFRVTAEGVENEAEEAHLTRTYCHEAQGFRYGRPCPAESFLEGPLSELARADVASR